MRAPELTRCSSSPEFVSANPETTFQAVAMPDDEEGYASNRLDQFPPDTVAVGYDPRVGRQLVAARDISPLEELFRDSPAVVAPQTAVGPVCLVCLRVLSHASRPENCAKCAVEMCSQECAEKHDRLRLGYGGECKVRTTLQPRDKQ